MPKELLKHVGKVKLTVNYIYMSKQVAHFKLPDQLSEANAFLLKNLPEAVSVNGDNIVVNYDDGMKNNDYKINELNSDITSQESDILNSRFQIKVATHFLTKYSKLLAELENTVVTEPTGKEKYDTVKERDTKISEYKKEIDTLTKQIASFEVKIDQCDVKIGALKEIIDSLK